MARLVEFGEISIDLYDQSDIMGTAQAAASLFGLPGGGSLDNYGSLDTFGGGLNRSKGAIVAGSTEEITETTLNQLKAQKGKRAKLWRLDAEGERQFTWARLLNVDITRTTEQARHLITSIQSVSVVFSCDTDTWYGEFEGIWQLNAGYKINDELQINSGDTITLAGSPQIETITITQDSLESKTSIRGVKIRVTAPAGSSFSSIEIANDLGATLLFTGTVAAGKTLIIDAETNAVTNDSVDAYDDLTVTLNADFPYSWFPLDLGDNEITITHNGADAIVFEYTEVHL